MTLGDWWWWTVPLFVGLRCFHSFILFFNLLHVLMSIYFSWFSLLFRFFFHHTLIHRIAIMIECEYTLIGEHNTDSIILCQLIHSDDFIYKLSRHWHYHVTWRKREKRKKHWRHYHSFHYFSYFNSLLRCLLMHYPFMHDSFWIRKLFWIIDKWHNAKRKPPGSINFAVVVESYSTKAITSFHSTADAYIPVYFLHKKQRVLDY